MVFLSSGYPSCHPADSVKHSKRWRKLKNWSLAITFLHSPLDLSNASTLMPMQYISTRLMASFSGQPGQAGTRKLNHSGFDWSKRWWGGSGISWTIWRSFALCSRQITTPVLHHSILQAKFSSWRSTNSIKALNTQQYWVNIYLGKQDLAM